MKKPTLPIKVETTFSVQYHDLDLFINQVFGCKDYNCVAEEEWDNDSEHKIRVTGDLTWYEESRLTKFRETGRAPFMLSHLLNWCANKGYISKGIYIVNVSW